MLRMARPCGFDSHRPLHFSLSGVFLLCPGTRRSHSTDVATRSNSRWSHRSIIGLPLISRIENRGQIWTLSIRGEDSSFVEIGRTEDRSLEHQNPDRA
jgi:hypothetical protein